MRGRKSTVKCKNKEVKNCEVEIMKLQVGIQGLKKWSYDDGKRCDIFQKRHIIVQL